MNLRHILLTTDLSEEARRAFRPVTALARESGARVTLYSVVLDLRVAPHGAPLAPPLSDPDVDRELELAREGLAAERQQLAAELSVDCVVEVAEDVPKAIARYAADHEVDLIALSTHGRTGFKRLFLGSVAEAVLHHAHVPVLCFPRK